MEAMDIDKAELSEGAEIEQSLKRPPESAIPVHGLPPPQKKPRLVGLDPGTAICVTVALAPNTIVILDRVY
jgi:hypothetical protein